MNTLNNENIPQEPINQEKIDTNLNQPIPETNQVQPQAEQEKEDPNWKAFREARKKDRAEREAAERKAAEKEAEVAALKAAMEAAFSKSAPNPQAYQQYYGINQGYDQPEETEEERLEKKVNAILAAKEQQYLKEQEEIERREYPKRLTKNFPDFHQVCSQENLDYLDYHYPELSRPLQRLPEGYDKWNDIYHAVKKFIPNYGNVKKDAVKADINMQKPRSISSTLSSPTGENPRSTWQEIEQRRAANWERMQKTLRGM